MALETDLSKRLTERLKDLRDGAASTVSDFSLIREDALELVKKYAYSAGYSQALKDLQTVMNEILDDLQKE